MVMVGSMNAYHGQLSLCFKLLFQREVLLLQGLHQGRLILMFMLLQRQDGSIKLTELWTQNKNGSRNITERGGKKRMKTLMQVKKSCHFAVALSSLFLWTARGLL